MANDEQRNAFERKQPQSTLADDRKNRFERHKEVIDADRKNTTVHDARVQHREEVRATWHRHDAPVSSTGTLLTRNLVNLKAAERAFTGAQSKSNPLPDPIALKAHVLLWRLETPDGREFIATPYNIDVLNNSLQHHLGIGWPVALETITASNSFALDHNHYDLRQRNADGNIVVRRGDKPFGGGAPVPLAPFIWPDERQALDADEIRLAIEQALVEKAQAQAMPFGELKAKVQQNYKPPKPGDPDLNRTY